MQTVIVQLTHQKALKLLQELEDLHIIKLLKKSISGDENLAQKFAGKLPKEIADKLQQQISDSRNEWDSSIS
jgi:hypothetical protein